MKEKKSWIIGIVVVIIIALVLFFIFNSKEYEVSFDTDGAGEIKTQMVKKNKKATRPDDPRKEGAEFIDWYLDDVEYDFDTPVKKDIRLVAKWKEQEEEIDEAKIKLDLGEGKTKTIYVQKGEKLKTPETPIREGYTFVSWQVDGKDYDFNQVVTKDLELIAKWDKKVEQKVVNKNTKQNRPAKKTNTTKKPNQKPNKPAEPDKPAKPEEPKKEDKYSYKVESFQMGSPQVRVIIKKNGNPIAAKEVLSSSGVDLGWYNDEYKVILTDLSEVGKIAKVKLNDDTIVDIVKEG